MKVLYPTGEVPVHSSYQQQVRESNIKHVFDLVRSGKCTSRTQLSHTLNLSATSASALVETLTRMGLVIESGPQRSIQPGRKPISLRFNNSARQLAMFDVTRESVRFALLNLSGRVIETYTCPMTDIDWASADIGASYVQVFEDILEHHSQIFDQERLLAIGISFPGHYSPRRHAFAMGMAMNICFTETTMQRFTRRMGVPVCFGNVAMCRAYAQKKHLDTTHPDEAETQDLLYVDIGARVGGAIISGGKVFIGPNGIGGEIGHLSIDPKGPVCACGNAGCLEQYLNLNAILAKAQAACIEQGVMPPDSFEMLAANYVQVPAMGAVVNEAAELLASGIYSMFCATGISQIVLGGGIEALGHPFLKALYANLVERPLLSGALQLSYAASNPYSESAGLAHYFLDHMMVVLGN